MIFPAWLAPLTAALFNPITGAVSVILVVTELGSGRPVQIPRISDASVASAESRVAFILLGAFSALFLFGAAATTYSIILAVPHPTRRRRRTATQAAPPVDSPSAPPTPPVPPLVARAALLCAAIASVALTVASGTTVFSGAHDNAVALYVVAELVWLGVVLVVLGRGRRRMGRAPLVAAAVALLGVLTAVVMLVTSLSLIRRETGGVEVVTMETLAARERVPAELSTYFNVFSLGEYVFLLALSAFNLCLTYALRHDRVYFGPPVGVGGGSGEAVGHLGSSVSSSSISDEGEDTKAPPPLAAVVTSAA